jgi:hypothetical protein
MAGPLVKTLWDLTTSRKCWCAGGVLSPQVKIPSVHQSIKRSCLWSGEYSIAGTVQKAKGCGVAGASKVKEKLDRDPAGPGEMGFES